MAPFDGAAHVQEALPVAAKKSPRQVPQDERAAAADELANMASTLKARAALLRSPNPPPDFVQETLALAAAVKRALAGDADWQTKLAAFCATEGLHLRNRALDADELAWRAARAAKAAESPKLTPARLKAVEGLILAYRDNVGGSGRRAAKSVSAAYQELFGVEPASIRKRRARAKTNP